MANGCGGGNYETCSSVGATADFGRRPFRAAFVSLFGSYFGDWDVTNNFMRAPLAGNATGDGMGLCCFWAGRPTFWMHHMATGNTLGYSMRVSMNSQWSAFTSPSYSPANFGEGGTHCGLLGDPSLRMHVVEPPRHLFAISASGSVNLAWAASTEPGLIGYHVYRGDSSAGPFTRLTPSALATPAYADATGTAGTSYTYMVRTLKLESSPGGTYQNLSVGEMATISVNSSPTGAPANPSGLAVTQVSGTNAQLAWQDNANDETGFRIERKVSGTGTFATLTTLAANATTYTDPGPFTNNEIYFYRVIATNGAGDSIPSNEASMEAIPGFFEFSDTVAKVAKTIGTAQIAVKRFGGVNGVVTVNYATSNSSATAGTHYTATSGTLTWPDGDTTDKNINVPITNTGSAQMPRQFRLTLSSPSSGTGIGTYNAVSVLIEDPTATLPGPWQQALVGTITDAGTAVQAEGAFASATIGGTGLATAATAEGGQFIYQTRTGDGVLTAFVPAASPVQSGARFAVMIRENVTSGGALMAGTAVSNTSGTFPARQISRATANATATYGTGVGAIQTPCWLRITRAGNSFQSEASTDGTNWVNQGSVSVAMAFSAQWGLFHTSDDRSTTTYSANYQTIGFQNVAFTTVSVPGAVGSFTAGTPTANSVALNWTAASSAAGYRLERRSETSTFAQIIDLPAATLTFTDSSLAANAGYEYRIYAYNGSGNGPLSNTLQVTSTAATVYASLTPDNDATINGGAQGTVFGSDPVLRVAGSSSTSSLATNTKAYLRFDLTGLPATATGATLRLTVAQTGNMAQSGYALLSPLRVFPEANDVWSESIINWTNAPLNNTTGNAFLAGTTFITNLSLTDPLSVPTTGAIITLPITASTLNTNRGANNLVTFGLNTATTGAWIEFASKEHSTLAPPLLELTFAPTLPTRPSFFTVNSGPTATLDLAWVDNATTETGFEIERRPAGGSFAPLITTAPDTVTYSDTTTTLGTTYEYRVRTVSAPGASAWSLVVAATAGGSTGPIPGERLNFANWASNQQVPDNGAADPDRDGLANLVEYALGTAASNANTSEAPKPGRVTQDGQQFLTLTFSRRLDVTDVGLIVEAASSLNGPWIEIDPLQPENQTDTRVNTPATGWQRLTVKDTQPMSASNSRFMRLRATSR